MTTPLVKICGISDPAHATIAAEAGADFIGLNFYPPSHRCVTPMQAAEIVETMKSNDRGSTTRFVGLFVNEKADTINQTAREAALDLVQLHGDEPPELAGEIELPVIVAVRVDPADPSPGRAAFTSWVESTTPPAAILLDTHVPGYFGGTGAVGNWELAAELARQYRIILAGGLDHSNVSAAIERVRPWAVDVSSGVETDKTKDPAKIRQFIRAARQVQAAT